MRLLHETLANTFYPRNSRLPQESIFLINPDKVNNSSRLLGARETNLVANSFDQALQEKASKLSSMMKEFMDEQAVKLPELMSKWGTSEYNQIKTEDLKAFREARDSFARDLKKDGYDYLGTGTSGLCFETEIENNLYTLKVYIVNTDTKNTERYGDFKNVAWTNWRDIYEMNKIAKDMRSKVNDPNRFQFVNNEARLIQAKDSKSGLPPVLAFPYEEGAPAIAGEINYKPIENWEVNNDFLKLGVSDRYIADFLNFMIAAQIREAGSLDVKETGRLHQTIFRNKSDKPGEIILLDPIGTYLDPNRPRKANPAKQSVQRRKSFAKNPLVAPPFTIFSSISFMDWDQKAQNIKGDVVQSAWHQSVINRLVNEDTSDKATEEKIQDAENKLEKIYSRNMDTLVSGLKMAIEDAPKFGHEKILTKEGSSPI